MILFNHYSLLHENVCSTDILMIIAHSVPANDSNI